MESGAEKYLKDAGVEYYASASFMIPLYSIWSKNCKVPLIRDFTEACRW